MGKIRKPVNAEKPKQLTIALIAPNLVDEYEADIWKYLVSRQKDLGFNLLVFTTGYFSEERINFYHKSRIFEFLGTSFLDGIIFVTACFTSFSSIKDIINYFRQFDPIPYVSIGIPLKGVPSVLVNNVKGVEQLITHLIVDHGYRKIAFVRGPSSNEEAEIRYLTYKATLERFNIPFDENIIYQTEYYITESNQKVTDQIYNGITKEKSIQAVVASTDFQAIYIIRGLTALGLKIPEQVAVAGYDDSPNSLSILPHLTTVHQSSADLAKKALDVLLKKLEGKKVPEKSVINSYAVIRRSCGCSYFKEPIAKNKNPGYDIQKPEDCVQCFENNIHSLLKSPQADKSIRQLTIRLGDALYQSYQNKDRKIFLSGIETAVTHWTEKLTEQEDWDLLLDFKSFIREEAESSATTICLK